MHMGSIQQQGIFLLFGDVRNYQALLQLLQERQNPLTSSGDVCSEHLETQVGPETISLLLLGHPDQLQPAMVHLEAFYQFSTAPGESHHFLLIALAFLS